VPKPQES
jgi:hypothetical protein